MAVVAEIIGGLVKRQYGSCPSGYYRSGSNCYPNSSWYWWGRWVLAGVLVLTALAIIIFCITARRRRKRGLNPMYGTGWMANQNKYGQAYPQTDPNYNQNGYGPGYQALPPAYGQPPVQNQQYTGTTFNPNDGYYGNQNNGHNEGIQLQQPPNAYQRDQYAPPTGPPPGK